MDTKRYISEESHMLDGFRLGRVVYEAGFRPTFIVGLWRGGSAVGIVVQECLAALGVETDHIALRTSYAGREQYEQAIRGQREIRVHGRGYLLETVNAEDNLLIVDDVFSSGRHTNAVVDYLRDGLKRNMPNDIRIATTWWRRARIGDPVSSNDPAPDFYVRQTDQWLVLPYEMAGLTENEIRYNKSFLLPLLEACGQLED